MDMQYVDIAKPVLTDVALFSVLGMFNIYAARFMSPTIRGFFCDDETIRYPFRISTVPGLSFYVVGVLISLITIVFMELRHRRRDDLKTKFVYQFAGRSVSPAYWDLYRMVACYGCGVLFSQLLTDVIKNMTGRLRPNFIYICEPDIMASSDVCVAGNYSYIENYKCQNSNEVSVADSRRSFPSGHASFSFYVAVFLVLYLQKRLKVRTLLLKPIIQYLFILLACAAAVTRVIDYKHHWSDVLVGCFLGSVVAIINTVYGHRIFDSEKDGACNDNTNHLHGVNELQKA